MSWEEVSLEASGARLDTASWMCGCGRLILVESGTHSWTIIGGGQMCLIGRRLKNMMPLAGLIDREEENEAAFLRIGKSSHIQSRFDWSTSGWTINRIKSQHVYPATTGTKQPVPDVVHAERAAHRDGDMKKMRCSVQKIIHVSLQGDVKSQVNV